MQSNRTVFFVLKLLNLVVITAYSFLLIYVLTRVLSLTIYPAAVLISSLGAYIIATDLGYSGFVYYRIRQTFISRGEPQGSEGAVFSLYMAIAWAGTAAMACAIAFFADIPINLRVALALYFLSIVLALPWGLLRKIAAAVDLYLAFELCELVRRLFFLGIAAAMLAGLSFMAFTLISLLGWLVAFVGAITLLRKRRRMMLITRSPVAVLSHLRSNYRDIARSGSLTLIEFVIYNFPYLIIPLLFTDKTTIIAFDIFYKVVRFGAVSYAVPAESILPSQTRAFYQHDRTRVMHHYRVVISLSLIPLAVSIAVLLGFGDRIFNALLSRGGIVGTPLRVSMVIMLVGMLFQTAAGTFLVSTGNYAWLSRLAFITVTLMACDVGLTWTLGLTFASFMYLYAGIYGVHAVLYTIYLRYFVRSMRPFTHVEASPLSSLQQP